MRPGRSCAWTPDRCRDRRAAACRARRCARSRSRRRLATASPTALAAARDAASPAWLRSTERCDAGHASDGSARAVEDLPGSCGPSVPGPRTAPRRSAHGRSRLRARSGIASRNSAQVGLAQVMAGIHAQAQRLRLARGRDARVQGTRCIAARMRLGIGAGVDLDTVRADPRACASPAPPASTNRLTRQPSALSARDQWRAGVRRRARNRSRGRK